MLKINNILSKKIKSSLSLREAKRRSNLSGFSLIELMVAVVILAIAILGIFLAFSSGWMGMANARDRTVATNYAREEMEDIKNMDFELITNENLGVTELIEGKFNRVVTVIDEHNNLKNINTKVFWTNRQSQYVSVETSMYINRNIYNPKEASKLVLYANPYYSVLPSETETIDLIAVIKDVNGNTKIDWTGENICFTINSGSELGSLTDGAGDGVDTIGGIAQTTFTPSNIKDEFGFPLQGVVEIKASVELPNDGGTIIDIITITVTLGVVRIELNASPTSIDADGTTTSTVTAKLVNAKGDLVSDAPNEIIFDISGEGTFVDSASEGLPLDDTVLMSNSGGEAIIYVESITDTPGVVTVTASSAGLLSDTVNIITTGVATSIFVSVEPNLIYEGDNAMVTVEIQDENGNPVEFTGEISLTASDGTVLSSLNFAGTSLAETTFSPATASPGTVTITASGGGLADGSATIEVRAALIADTISLSAIPKNILAGGDADSEITAIVKQGSTVISNYKRDITFKIISDTSSSQNAELSFNSGDPYGLDFPLTVTGVQYGSDGIAVVDLKPASEVGICTIEVSTDNLVDPEPIVNTIEVGFYSSEDHIELSADPSKMLVEGDNCTVTAEVVDEKGILVTTYNEDITFTILVGWPKIAKFVMTGTSSLTQTLNKGETTVDLIPQKEAGTVTLKASSFTGMTDITGYLNIPVVTTPLELAPDPNINYGVNQVSFDIEVQGTEISLDEMQVSWSDNIDSEILNKIDIGGNEVYLNGDGVVSGTVVVTVTTLPIGIYTINLYFNGFAVMSGKTFNIIFNPNSGNYPVEISEPPI